MTSITDGLLDVVNNASSDAGSTRSESFSSQIKTHANEPGCHEPETPGGTERKSKRRRRSRESDEKFNRRRHKKEKKKRRKRSRSPSSSSSSDSEPSSTSSSDSDSARRKKKHKKKKAKHKKHKIKKGGVPDIERLTEILQSVDERPLNRSDMTVPLPGSSVLLKPPPSCSLGSIFKPLSTGFTGDRQGSGYKGWEGRNTYAPKDPSTPAKVSTLDFLVQSEFKHDDDDKRRSGKKSKKSRS